MNIVESLKELLSKTSELKERNKIKSKIYYQTHKEYKDKKSKEWQKKNKLKAYEYTKKWRDKNIDRHKSNEKIWRSKNTERINFLSKRHRENNYSKIVEQRKNNPQFLMKQKYTSRVNLFYKRSGKRKYWRGKDLLKSEELCGCSIEFLKNHLGEKLEKYSLDHIIPCCKFDLTKQEEVLKCYHWSNLRFIPLKDNQKKHMKII